MSSPSCRADRAGCFGASLRVACLLASWRAVQRSFPCPCDSPCTLCLFSFRFFSSSSARDRNHPPPPHPAMLMFGHAPLHLHTHACPPSAILSYPPPRPLMLLRCYCGVCACVVLLGHAFFLAEGAVCYDSR
eukprot:159996-Rhodomonas_salina.1